MADAHIAVTARAEEYSVAAFEAGADDYITSPLSQELNEQN